MDPISRKIWKVPEPDSGVERLLRLLSPDQVSLLADSLSAILAGGGFGSVRITVRCGKPKQIETSVTREIK